MTGPALEEARADAPARAAGAGRLAALGVAALVVASFWVGTAGTPLGWPDEPRVAGVAAEMLDGGSRAIPTLGGRPFLEQPPLAYWGIALALGALGRDDAAARVPGVLWGLLGALATGLLAARLTGDRRAGAFAGGALLVTAEWSRMSHRAMVDAPLAGAVAWTVYLLYLAVDEPARRRWWFPLAGLAAAAAFFAKGAIGLVFPACAFVGLVAARRDLALLRSPWLWVAPVACVAAVTPWLLALYAEAGWEPLRVVFVDNHLKRFVPSLGDYAGGHQEPWHYYLRVAPGALLPLTLLLPAGVAALVRARTPAARDLLGLLGGWLGLGLLFLTAAGTKRQNYVLPLVPAVALVAGAWLASLRDGARPRGLDALTVGALALGAVAAPFAPPAVALALDAGAAPTVWLAAAVALAASAAALVALRGGRTGAFAVAAGLAATAVSGGVAGAIVAAGGRARELVGFTRAIGERVPAGARLCVLGHYEAMVGGTSFYLGRRMDTVPDLAAARAALTGPTPAYVVVLERRGRGEDPRDIAALTSAGATPLLVEEREGGRFVAALLGPAPAGGEGRP